MDLGELLKIRFGKASNNVATKPPAMPSSTGEMPVDPYEMPEGMSMPSTPSATGQMPVDPVSTYQEFLDGLMRIRDEEMVYGYGDTGEEVARIQQMVGVEPDGVWGPETQRAVQKFQQMLGVDVDGLWGVKTERAAQDKLNRPYMQAATTPNPAGMFDPRMLAPEQSPMIDRNQQRNRMFNSSTKPGYTG